MKKYDESEGFWRTVGGRRMFIKNGQDLASAMKESGKFNLSRSEYKLYKQAKENPDSIDPMTENSTDWEELDKKYSDRYESDKISDRIKENKIVDSYEKYVIYQNKDGNWITSRENYNNFVNGKSDKLGGELILNEKEGRERLANYVADDKYPYKGYVDDMKSGNGKKAEAYKKEILDKMHKTIGYDESKYNYGLENKMSNSKYTIDYFKKRGVEIFDKAPDGYIKLEGATTAPKGYEWYSNGKSRFGGEYKNALVKTVDNQITNSLRQKAYNKYMKEHPGSKMSFEEFLKNRG